MIAIKSLPVEIVFNIGSDAQTIGDIDIIVRYVLCSEKSKSR